MHVIEKMAEVKKTTTTLRFFVVIVCMRLFLDHLEKLAKYFSAA